jgi:hypothetical protein
MEGQGGALHLILYDTSPLKVAHAANLAFAVSTGTNDGDRSFAFANANMCLHRKRQIGSIRE